jgi:3-carboxy-cis,cis-muconate cycloisomerase
LHAEWGALGGALAYTGAAAGFMAEALDGLEVRPRRMRENLDAGGGLVLAEAVSTALAERVGRLEAHGLVEAASRRAAESGRSLRDELHQDPRIGAQLSSEEIDRALDPEAYLGSADAFVDRALERYRTRP